MPPRPEWAEIGTRAGTIRTRNSGERKRSREGKKGRRDKRSGGGGVFFKKWHIISPQARLSPFSYTVGSSEVCLVCASSLRCRDISSDEGISCLCMYYCAPAAGLPCLLLLSLQKCWASVTAKLCLWSHAGERWAQRERVEPNFTLEEALVLVFTRVREFRQDWSTQK